MKLICVDDFPLHLNLLISTLKAADASGEFNFEKVKTCVNGIEAVEAVKACKASGTKIDLITLDIRMPEMDGLSALVAIKSINPVIKCVMASSEDEDTVKKHGSKRGDNLSMEQKLGLISKVALRIRSGKKEEGKINLILDACDELCLSPIEMAKYFKADGFLHKPYTPEKVSETFKKVMSGSEFVFLS